jgi:3-dehydroquinate synthase
MARKPRVSELLFLERFPARKSAISDPATTLLIFDRRLSRASTEFRKWSANFPHKLGLDSGESLKALSRFPVLAEKLARLAQDIAPKKLTVVAVGGGSIGDFAGFFASVYKRGVRLVHVPSTWLSAIDSSHGGKTALNSSSAKNQFGTFYPAEKTVLVRSLLATQPGARVRDGMGELGKIALLEGGQFAHRLGATKLSGPALLWAFLKPAIEAKLKIVAKDPFEKNGHRQLLNFGHTMGHVFETAMNVSHGHAVALGVFFALEFSLEKGLLTASGFERAADMLTHKLGLGDAPGDVQSQALSSKRFAALLRADKKRASSNKIVFVFLRSIGRPIRVEVTFDELAREARRQGWLK